MKCSEYLALSSEFRDGQIQAGISAEIEAHLGSCPMCHRHQEALREGVDLLRSIPGLDVSVDFRARLEHRIFHIEDGALIAREAVGSGATTLAVVGVAVLLALAAWAPRAGILEPAVELPAVVVSAPAPRIFTASHRRPTFPGGPSVFTTAGFQDGPWGDTHQILFRYSSLSERRRTSVLTGVGVQ